jgi:hypothetical protein
MLGIHRGSTTTRTASGAAKLSLAVAACGLDPSEAKEICRRTVAELQADFLS